MDDKYPFLCHPLSLYVYQILCTCEGCDCILSSAEKANTDWKGETVLPQLLQAPVASCVILGKFLDISVPSVLPLEMTAINSTSFTGA